MKTTFYINIFNPLEQVTLRYETELPFVPPPDLRIEIAGCGYTVGSVECAIPFDGLAVKLEREWHDALEDFEEAVDDMLSDGWQR